MYEKTVNPRALSKRAPTYIAVAAALGELESAGYTYNGYLVGLSEKWRVKLASSRLSQDLKLPANISKVQAALPNLYTQCTSAFTEVITQLHQQAQEQRENSRLETVLAQCPDSTASEILHILEIRPELSGPQIVTLLHRNTLNS